MYPSLHLCSAPGRSSTRTTGRIAGSGPHRVPRCHGGTMAHYGKYRGRVESVIDPMGLMRIRVTVPAVLDEAAVWATPCVPVGYLGVPAVGSGVWVEFEGGDTDYPIWSGCWVEVPGTVPAPEGIEISNGQGASVKLTGPTVSVNDGALDVT